MKYRILLVEDDRQIREIVTDYFSGRKEDEVTVTCACSGEEGLGRIMDGKFDLAILDIMLPGINGFELCRELRRGSSVPVIFLTARGQEEDKLRGYALGCDDYVVKPFSLAVLYAKARAMIRRAKGTDMDNIITVGDIRLYADQHAVYAGGEKVQLAPKEYELLQYFMEHPRQALARERLLIRVWGYDFDGMDRVVDNHIKKLRKKLGGAGKQIKTIVKKGYKLEER